MERRIKKLLDEQKDLILVVRKKLLEKVINKWELTQAQIFDISEYNYIDVEKFILSL